MRRAQRRAMDCPYLGADGGIYCGRRGVLLERGRGAPAGACTASRFAEEHGEPVLLEVRTLERGERVRCGAADLLLPIGDPLLTREEATGALREWTRSAPLRWCECAPTLVARRRACVAALVEPRIPRTECAAPAPTRATSRL